jgi:hypothetical protein
MSSFDKVVPLVDIAEHAAGAAAAGPAASPVAAPEPGAPQLGLAPVVTPAETDLSLDLCFVTDSTGSMKEPLKSLKTVICDMVKMYQEHPAFSGWKIRISIILFNDWDKKQFIKGSYKGTIENCPTLICVPFTEDIEHARQTIMGVEAIGGDDMPEDVNSAIKCALNLGWSGTVRILIFATDACGHGFTNSADNFPNGDPAGETKESTLVHLRCLAERLRVDFKFINIRPSNSEPMRLAFKKVYDDALAENPDAGTFSTQDMLPAQSSYVPSHRPSYPDPSVWAGGCRSDEYDDGEMDRCGGGDFVPMCLPRMEATPSDITMSRAISDSTSAAIYKRTGLTPLAAIEPSMSVASVSSLGVVPEGADLPPLSASVSDKVTGSDLP